MEESLSGYAQLGIPRLSRADCLIHRINIFYAILSQPILKRLRALLGVNRNPFFPGRTAAENTRVIGTGLRCHVQRLDELCIADSRAQVNERLLRHLGASAVMVECLLARVGGLSLVHRAALHILGV